MVRRFFDKKRWVNLAPHILIHCAVPLHLAAAISRATTLRVSVLERVQAVILVPFVPLRVYILALAAE